MRRPAAALVVLAVVACGGSPREKVGPVTSADPWSLPDPPPETPGICELGVDPRDHDAGMDGCAWVPTITQPRIAELDALEDDGAHPCFPIDVTGDGTIITRVGNSILDGRIYDEWGWLGRDGELLATFDSLSRPEMHSPSGQR